MDEDNDQKETPPPSPIALEMMSTSEWSSQEEFLFALWGDRSLCYRILSERCAKKYNRENLYFSLPVIILSTLCGSANLAIQSYVPESMRSTASMIIGCVNLFAGVLSTLQNFFRLAEKASDHRSASIAWGKYHRLIFAELSLARSKRRSVKECLKQFKQEYDRLLDQTPPIPSTIIESFVQDIAKHPQLLLPEECGHILHTSPWEHVREERSKILNWVHNKLISESLASTP